MVEQIDVDELVGNAIAGDEDALSKLLERFGARLHARVASRTNDRFRSMVSPEDVLQVTFAEAFLRIKSFQPNGPDSFEAWLTRIADHNLIDAIRGLERKKDPPLRKRIAPATSDESYDSLLAGIDGSFTTPSHGAARIEIKPIIDNALDKLPAGYQQVLRLFDMEGKTAVEVGQAMDKSEAAIYMIAGRARKRLAELLGSSSQYFSK